MQPQVHDISKLRCGICGMEFKSTSLTLCIRSTRVGSGIISRTRVCFQCYEDHYGKSE